MKAYGPLLCLVLLAGCGPQGDEAGADPTPVGATGQPAEQDTTIDLAAHGLPLVLKAPHSQLTEGQSATVNWKEESGQWLISAGEHFGLVIAEEPGDLGRLKADLDRDPLHKNSILRESPDHILYKTEFPDEPTVVLLHFYQVVRAGDRTFTVQDETGKTFNQLDVERMLGAISPAQPA